MRWKHPHCCARFRWVRNGSQWGLNVWQWGLRVHIFTLKLQERHNLYFLTMADAIEAPTLLCALPMGTQWVTVRP